MFDQILSIRRIFYVLTLMITLVFCCAFVISTQSSFADNDLPEFTEKYGKNVDAYGRYIYTNKQRSIPTIIKVPVAAKDPALTLSNFATKLYKDKTKIYPSNYSVLKKKNGKSLKKDADGYAETIQYFFVKSSSFRCNSVLLA